VEREGGTTGIDVEVDSMRPALLFGGDYNTYVLWIVPPGRPAENIGELVLNGSESRFHAMTHAATFAVMITAEPHYLVTAPSAFVVLENGRDPQAEVIQQPLVEGFYNFSRSTLKHVKEAKGPVYTDVNQAFTAVRLAQRAGALDYAPEEFSAARRSLDHTLTLWQQQKDRTQIAEQARRTIWLAVAAQRLARDHVLQAPHATSEGLGGGNGETEGRDLRGSVTPGGK